MDCSGKYGVAGELLGKSPGSHGAAAEMQRGAGSAYWTTDPNARTPM
jgi:hypothetical protein